MGIFDSLMPGEESGMPTSQRLGGWQGALSGNNPMMNVGLGILANNSGNYGSAFAALGKGAQQGIQSSQLAQQQAQQAALYKLQMAKAMRDEAEAKKLEEAIAAESAKNPEFANLYRIDAKAALKAQYPNANSADPYTEVIYDEQGQGWLNNRRETDPNKVLSPIMINGKPFIGAKQSPDLAGRIKGAEAQAGAAWKPNTNIDGQVLTDEQVSNMARGNQPAPFSMPNPQQLPSGIPPNMQIPPQVQKQRDDVRLQVLLAEQAQYGGAGNNPELDQEIANVSKQTGVRPMGGIRVPTKLETKQGEANIDLNKELAVATGKADIERSGEKIKNVKKADQFLTVAQQAKSILDGTDKPTASGVGSVVDSALGTVGLSTKGADQAGKLATISGWLVANVPRMEGPQSNFDVENYKTMAGMVGDKTKPLSIRKAALDEVIALQEKYKDMNSDGNIAPNNAKPPPKAKPPMKGQVVDGYKFKGGNPADPKNWTQQ